MSEAWNKAKEFVDSLRDYPDVVKEQELKKILYRQGEFTVDIYRQHYNEQNPEKLQRYYDYVKNNYKLEGEPATQIVNEAFLYLKLKNSKDVDPIKEGDQFGAGFS